nr:unnamed protein product [Digitaria exilis]
MRSRLIRSNFPNPNPSSRRRGEEERACQPLAALHPARWPLLPCAMTSPPSSPKAAAAAAAKAADSSVSSGSPAQQDEINERQAKEIRRASEALKRAVHTQPTPVRASPPDLHAAMMFQEEAALLNLHAQAVAVHNIHSLVTIVLDVSSGNFNRWRDQCLLTLGKFSLQDHQQPADPAAALPQQQASQSCCCSRSYQCLFRYPLNPRVEPTK